jgi:hypothetical protein
MIGVLFYNEAFELPLLIGGALMLIGNLVGVRGLTAKSIKVKHNI